VGRRNFFHIYPVAPYDFELCLRVAESFSPDRFQGLTVFRQAVRIQDKPAILEWRQVSRDPAEIEVRSTLKNRIGEIERTAKRVIAAELDLMPFYRLASSHPVLGPITRELKGLKPLRPVSLFEMLVIAITEQQISLAAAYRIRTRLVERLGDRLDGLWAFPSPQRMRECTIADLMSCGLSRRKSEYVQAASSRIADGIIDLEGLETRPDEEVRSLLIRERGLGPWSAEYFMVRGLGRPDRVPANDLGIQKLTGRYLGRGQRLTPRGVMRKLSPFRPYRGLAVFYLLAHDRLMKKAAQNSTP